MIPVRLTMRNFMCYRENVPPLDFTGIHLACLSGSNGNGKSAIIDAMTWALWGKARAGSIDDLIHALAKDMEVQFDFAIGDDLYRILRKRTRPKKKSGAGQSSLEFQIASGDEFRPLTGTSIDETQQTIINTLHMDYDTFINSAYLRQGHADEFTRQAAGKRKEVLGTILGLERYDELEERAKTLARQYEVEIAQIETALADMTAELERRPDDEAALHNAQQELDGIEAGVREKETALNGLRQKKEALDARQAQLDELTANLAENTRLKNNWEEQAGQHRERIAQYEQVIARREDITATHARYAAAKAAAEDMAMKFRQAVDLERRKTETEKRIDRARNELLQKQALALQKIEELETRAATLPEAREKLAAAEAQVKELAQREAALAEKDAAAREAQRAASLHEADIARLERETGEVVDKLEMLARHRQEHTDARCPLCESELTQEGLALIEEKYRKEKAEKAVAMVAAQEALEEARARAAALKEECGALEAALKQEQARLHGTVSVLRNEIVDKENDEARLVKGRAYIEEVTGQLEEKSYAADDQAALAALEQELAVVGYDEAAHREAQGQVTTLQSAEAEKQRLDEAERLVAQERTAEQHASEAAKGLQEALQRDTGRQEALRQELTGLAALREAVTAAETAYREAAARASVARETVGSIKARLQRLDELATKKKEREQAFAAAGKEASVYKELARAFGKGGIQALLIDNAIPDIENEANRLLSKMTDNRMHLTFETQRITKQGTLRETLDITITDELGTRDYEMFSGGEAFRINFAIRIALSRLLARRAGAPLPTLIIDEGFGTQDSSGLEKLKEAINSIQNDFQKILVITHMDDLKDAFPVRIDVVKTPEGSTITVN